MSMRSESARRRAEMNASSSASAASSGSPSVRIATAIIPLARRSAAAFIGLAHEWHRLVAHRRPRWMNH